MSFACLYGILSKKSSFMIPWMSSCFLSNIVEGLDMFCIAIGIEEPWMKVIPFNKALYLSCATVFVAFNLYKLNGFYSLFKQIKNIKEQTRHQIFYDNDQEQI